MKERLTKAEIRKDALQDGVEAAAATVGQVTTIVVGAVRDVARTVGGFANDLFEIRDAARRASEDHEIGTAWSAETDVHLDPDPGEATAADVHPDPDAPTT
jgi:hypothetical protein